MTINTTIDIQRGQFSLRAQLVLPSNGVSVIFGHSGSGKTTLLRAIAGLDRASHANVSFNGIVWQDAKLFVPVHQRRLAYVFQEASLFNHLDVRQNLAFARRRSHGLISDADVQTIVDLLGIDTLLQQDCPSLSGGEKQRVAIARALISKPDLLLMDEPLASLDIARKQEILPYFEALKQNLKLPIVYVTHSVDEVARLADYLVTLESGCVTAAGDAKALLNQIDFPIPLGEDTSSIVEATISERDNRWHLMCARFAGGQIWLKDTGHELHSRLRLRIFARDVSIALSHSDNSSIVNSLPATIVAIKAEQHPATALMQLQVGTTSILARLTQRSIAHLNLSCGREVWLQIKSAAVVQ